MMKPLVEVGFVRRSHGVRGELRVETHNPDSEILAAVKELWLGETRFTIDVVRHVPDGWLVKLVGLDDRTRADTYKGQAVQVARSALGLADGEVLLDDLIGFSVRLVSGETWGKVVALEPGPQDRLVIRDAAFERLLPFVKPIVVSVDAKTQTLLIDPPAEWPSEPIQ